MNDCLKLREFDLIEDKSRKVRLIEEVAAGWEKIATHLYFESRHIQSMKRDNTQNSKECCRAVFVDWMEGRGRQPITWKVLIDAMSQAGFPRVAEDLKSIFSHHN